MMPGCITLGLASAFRFPGGGEAFTRQPLPAWAQPDRPRPPQEPLPVWISPFGHLADGPLSITRSADLVFCHRYYASWYGGKQPDGQGNNRPVENPDPAGLLGAGCLHLTLAAQCWFDADFTHLHVQGPVFDYALRPYRWQEPEVQAAYETVSDGAVTASEIDTLADVGKSDTDPADGDTIDHVRDIHGAWTEAAADYLAFGTGTTRPFSWNARSGADDTMALPARAGYACPSSHVYNIGTQYEPYEKGAAFRKKCSGQGFIAWRRCEDNTPGVDGIPDGDDWLNISRAILGTTVEEQAPVRRRPLAKCGEDGNLAVVAPVLRVLRDLGDEALL